MITYEMIIQLVIFFISNRKGQNINLKLDFCYANNDILKKDFICKQILHAMGNLIVGPDSVVCNTLM
jgi:hypothetical protein